MSRRDRASPAGGPGARRLTRHVAPDRRIALEDAARRPGRTSSSTTFNGCQAHWALDWDSHVTREVGAVQPTHRRMRSESCWRRSGSCGRAGASWTSTWGRGQSPRLAPGAAPGGHIIACPWRLLLEVPGMRCWRVGVSCGVEDDARRRVLAASRRTGRGP